MVSPARISRTWVAKARRYSVSWAAIALLTAPAGANSEVYHPQYERLQEALAEYQQMLNVDE